MSAPRLLRASARLYALLLAAYPPAFRASYGREMAQVFQQQCRAAYSAAGNQGLLRLWGRTLSDLVGSSVQQRFIEPEQATGAAIAGGGAMMSREGGILRLLPYPLVVVFGLALAWVNLHTDETPFVALPLLAAAFVIGALQPRGAWRWAVLLGAIILFFQWIAMLTQTRLPYPNSSPGDLIGAAIGLGLFAFAGAYGGVLARRVLRAASGDSAS